MNAQEKQQRIYRRCFNNSDVTKADKIIKGITEETINSLNYWDTIRKLTVNVRSDRAIHRWQCISEMVHREFFEQEVSL